MPKLHLYRLSLLFVSCLGAFSAWAQEIEPERDSPLLAILLTWGPVLVIVGLWIYFMRQFSGSRASKGYVGRSLEQMGKIEEHLERTSASVENLSKNVGELVEHVKRHKG